MEMTTTYESYQHLLYSLANRQWHEDHRYFMDQLADYDDLFQEIIEHILKNRDKPDLKELVNMVENATRTLWDEVDKVFPEEE